MESKAGRRSGRTHDRRQLELPHRAFSPPARARLTLQIVGEPRVAILQAVRRRLDWVGPMDVRVLGVVNVGCARERVELDGAAPVERRTGCGLGVGHWVSFLAACVGGRWERASRKKSVLTFRRPGTASSGPGSHCQRLQMRQGREQRASRVDQDRCRHPQLIFPGH